MANGKKPVKVLVVGCGRMGRRHVETYLEMGNVQVAVCDVCEKLAKEAASSFGVDYETEFPRALERFQPDAVDVCTPTKSHYELVMEALRSGANVFCEKPLAGTYDEVKAIAEEADKRERSVMVGYLYRFHPAIKMLKEMVEEGALGSVHTAIFRIGGRGGHREWKHELSTFGGAVLEMMTHMIDLAIWLFGDAKRVELLYGGIVLPKREVEGKIVEVTAEDMVFCRMSMESGAEVICEGDQATPSYMHYVEVLGTSGNVFTSIVDWMPTSVYLKQRWRDFGEGRTVRKFGYVNLLREELNYFVKCLSEGRKVEINTAWDSVKVAGVVEKLRQQLRSCL